MPRWLYYIIGFSVALVGCPLLLVGGVLLMKYLPEQGYLPVGAVLFILCIMAIARLTPRIPSGRKANLPEENS